MAWHPSTIVQLCGIIFSFFGLVLSCVTTAVPFWKNRNLDLNEFEEWNMGLWQVCIFQEENIMECQAFWSLLALPMEIKISRILMVLSNGLGSLAFFLSLLGSNCLKARNQRSGLKKCLGAAGGTLFCASGVTTLVPVSWVAYNIVQEFWDQTLPEIVPRWEFGEALFLGWFAGFFLIVGGLLLVCSTSLLETPNPPSQLAAHYRPAIQNPPRSANHHPTSLPAENTDLVI